MHVVVKGKILCLLDPSIQVVLGLLVILQGLGQLLTCIGHLGWSVCQSLIGYICVLCVQQLSRSGIRVSPGHVFANLRYKYVK